jgi:hypothetical protein
MERGQEFLKAQVNNVAMQHASFIKNLEDHADQADDSRYRDLCLRFIPLMREHQRMLEDYQRQIGAESGTLKRALGSAIGVARDLADAARESDFLRLVGDIVAGRQSEDAFKTFREAGRMLGDAPLQRLGEVGEEHHDRFVHEANRLVQLMFVEHVRDVTPGASIEARDVAARRARDARM